MRARLYTSAGEYVCMVKLLPFNEWPDVVVWGTRLFKLQKGTVENDVPEYSEAFAVAAIEWEFEENR